MNFALYELSQRPDLQERLRTEIKEVLRESNGEITYDNIKKMSYLQQVLDGKYLTLLDVLYKILSIKKVGSVSGVFLKSELHQKAITFT